MSKEYDFLDYTNEDKLLRLKIKEKAEDFRIRYAKKGMTDIFDIVENEAVLFIRPEDEIKMSGATIYAEGEVMMFINSAYTLGHQRFTAAHELGHIVLHNKDVKSSHLLKKDMKLEKEADLFATELLMPSVGVEEVFLKLIDSTPSEVSVDDVIVMHNYFKVSYKAMLKRIVYLGLCEVDKYEELVEWCNIENEELLRKKTESLGYTIDLISKDRRYYIDKEYEHILLRNYKSGAISFRKYAEVMEYMNKNPYIGGGAENDSN